MPNGSLILRNNVARSPDPLAWRIIFYGRLTGAECERNGKAGEKTITSPRAKSNCTLSFFLFLFPSPPSLSYITFTPPSNFHGDVKRAYAFSDLSFRSWRTFTFGLSFFFSSQFANRKKFLSTDQHRDTIATILFISSFVYATSVGLLVTLFRTLFSF